MTRTNIFVLFYVIQNRIGALVNIAGSRDETVRAWNVVHGTPVTLFDVHLPIADVIITSDACRIAIRLDAGKHVPFLCLHNSPAFESTVVKSRSQVQLSMLGGK